MFEGSLVESTALLQSRNRWPALLSFATQTLVALLLVAVPLLHPELLPLHAPSLSLTPPPPPRPPQPPPPTQRVRAAVVTASAPEVPSAPPAQRDLLRTLLPISSVSADPPIALASGPAMPGAATAVLGFGDRVGPAPTVTVTPAPANHAGPVRLSSGVTAGLLLEPIRAAYPPIARAAHIEGAVVIHAIISPTGRIERAEVRSGSPMLQNAALEAVQSARYRPYLLNGQPTEVDTTITVNFRLGS